MNVSYFNNIIIHYLNFKENFNLREQRPERLGAGILLILVNFSIAGENTSKTVCGLQGGNTVMTQQSCSVHGTGRQRRGTVPERKGRGARWITRGLVPMTDPDPPEACFN